MELERSTDNYKSITESVRRTSELLNESGNTVQDIRRQMYEVRKVFEDMANYIDNIDNSNE